MDNLIHADCLDAMAEMDADSIDAIVTDPPYGLEFMGKGWDSLRPGINRGGRAPGRSARDDTKRAPVEYGTAPKRMTYACAACGKRDKFRKDHGCESPSWDQLHLQPDTGGYGRAMQDWHEAWAREAYRVAKPGAHLLAFGGTRTVHRLAAAIEDAGWEIRDMLVWGYASGFPKSLDVSKAIDRAAGATPTVTGPHPTNTCPGGEWCRCETDGRSFSPTKHPAATAPATPDAEKWNGWGTALKPAWEPIVMARKPLRGTVASNVLRHGTGALNIDGTRIGYESDADFNRNANFTRERQTDVLFGASSGTQTPTPAGRWPANVILTDPIFDGGVEGVVGGGETTSGKMLPTVPNATRTVFGQDAAAGYETMETYGDSGTYSRFFLIPKSARSEREPVLGGHGLTEGPRVLNSGSSGRTLVDGEWVETHSTPRTRANVHPTVKPLDLMRHLVRLVTPPGGTVLDPFLGSGTTALAAEMEGFAWIGIEKEADYIAITEARLNGTQMGLGLGA